MRGAHSGSPLCVAYLSAVFSVPPGCNCMGLSLRGYTTFVCPSSHCGHGPPLCSLCCAVNMIQVSEFSCRFCRCSRGWDCCTRESSVVNLVRSGCPISLPSSGAGGPVSSPAPLRVVCERAAFRGCEVLSPSPGFMQRSISQTFVDAGRPLGAIDSPLGAQPRAPRQAAWGQGRRPPCALRRVSVLSQRPGGQEPEGGAAQPLGRPFPDAGWQQRPELRKDQPQPLEPALPQAAAEPHALRVQGPEALQYP